MVVKKMESTGWALWWLWLWAVVTVALLALIPFLRFSQWAVAVVAWFGTMEGIGMLQRDDAYPPLTHIICRYVPRWIAFTLIDAFTGGAGGHWFGMRGCKALRMRAGP